jgi:P27 family predicted phage terminase small subunit
MKAPKHLAAPTRAWWDSVIEQYQLEPHHLKLLQLAAEAWDRCQEARETLARDGLIVTSSKGGICAHPCVAIERDARLAFARIIRELDLDAGAPSEAPRPHASALPQQLPRVSRCAAEMLLVPLAEKAMGRRALGSRGRKSRRVCSVIGGNVL